MKIALVTGTTGGIGGAFAKVLLENGYIVYAPVRDIAKGLEIFPGEENIFFDKLNLSDFTEVKTYLKKMKDGGVFFDIVFLAAGWIAFDSDFPGKDKEEKEKNAIAGLMDANFTTKETVVTGLMEVYKGFLKGISLGIVSSQAANFSFDDYRRVDEEGYVRSQIPVSALAKKLIREGEFGKVTLEEPALVDTHSAKKAFPEEKVGKNAEFKSRHAFAEEVFEKMTSN